MLCFFLFSWSLVVCLLLSTSCIYFQFATLSICVVCRLSPRLLRSPPLTLNQHFTHRCTNATLDGEDTHTEGIQIEIWLSTERASSNARYSRGLDGVFFLYGNRQQNIDFDYDVSKLPHRIAYRPKSGRSHQHWWKSFWQANALMVSIKSFEFVTINWKIIRQ